MCHRIALCTVCFTNDRSFRLYEFLMYYHWIGCSEFFLYLNYTFEETSLRTELLTICPNVTLHLLSYPGVAQQFVAYRDFYHNHRGRYEYALIVDTDEFLYLKTHNTILEWIQTQPPQQTLLLPRKEFGPHQCLVPQTRSQIWDFTEVLSCFHFPFQKIPFKSLVYCPDWTNGVPCLHNPTRCGVFQGQVYSTPWYPRENEHTFSEIQLNHYYTRSLQEFGQKVDGLRADVGTPKIQIPRIQKTLEYIESFQHEIQTDDGLKNKLLSSHATFLSVLL